MCKVEKKELDNHYETPKTEYKEIVQGGNL